MRLKGETVSFLPFSLSLLPLLFLFLSLSFSLSPLPSPFPCCACHAGYKACCTAGSASFPVVLGDFGCDVTVGSKVPLVTLIARTGLGMRLLPVDMKDEYLIPGSGLESVAKMEYLLSEIEQKLLKGHYWHNLLVSHYPRWQDSHWPQPHNTVISANYLQTRDIWVDKNGLGL